MKSNTKSSITLPARELAVVRRLKRQLHVNSNVEVVRRGLALLAESLEREQRRREFMEAAAAVREATLHEMRELDHLAGDGLR